VITPEYPGPERRISTAADDLRLDSALNEIRRLHGAATDLALAVSHTVPREEVEARERQFRYQLVALAVAVVISAMLIPLVVNTLMDSRFDKLNDGQRIQSCLMTKAEAERTGPAADTALLSCTQKERR
jgi:hypothetical protein